MDLGTFHVDSVIVHDVPRRMADGDLGDLTLSELPSSLTPELRNFFRERIIRSLNRHAFDVEHDPGATSPVPGRVLEIIAGDSQLVTASQATAQHLHASQTGVNPAGLVVVCRGKVAKAPCCAVLKLEREDAIRVARTKREGRLTFDVAHLRDLMLGQGTKVFKASLFLAPGASLDSLVGRVSDNQAPGADGVASFFLRRFLGCKLREAPEVATKLFFEVSQDWINTVPDPAKRARYEIALLAHLHDQSTSITPRAFAQNNLLTADRAPYQAHLASHGVPPGRFPKDTRLIASRIKQVSVTFANSSLRVAGVAEDVEEYVRFNPPSGKAAPVEILDAVKDIRGRS